MMFKADLFRIFRKKTFYTYTLICTVAYFSLIYIVGSDYLSGDMYIGFVNQLLSLTPMVIGIFLYSIFYGDDLKTKNSQSVLGYGYTRRSLIIQKLVTFIFLIVFAYLYFIMIVLLAKFVFSLEMDKAAYLVLLKSSILQAIKILVISIMTNVIAYGTQSSTSALVSFVLLSTGTVNALLSVLLSQKFVTDVFGNIQQYLVSGLLNTISFKWGMENKILVNELWILLSYIPIFLILSIIVFEKKELEF